MTAYDPALIERLDMETLSAFDDLPVPGDGSASRLHLTARAKIATMADQLQAAVLEVGRLAKLSALQSRLLNDNAAAYHAIRRAHEAEVEALSATRRELDAWKQMYESAEQSAAKLTYERDALRAEVERLRSAFAAAAQQLHDACLDCGCARFVRTQLDEATAPTAGKEGE